MGGWGFGGTLKGLNANYLLKKAVGIKWIALFFLVILAAQLYQANLFAWDPTAYLFNGK